MDKYEYKLKLEQIKSLVEVKEYEAAARIADEINWRRVKSIATLGMIAEIYENIKQLEESKELLLIAYNRSPTGRTIVYRLACLALKMGSIEEAQEYYEEFIDIAPHDNAKYVLRYEIAKEKGISVQELIEILEEFKEREYTEEWAFELAYLYHKAGNIEKCVDVCDELILWFGEGKYVEKALELKMLYQPLNKLQEDKYRRFKQKREGIIEVSPYDELKSGEIVREKVTIPKVTPDSMRFNTINLQEELAKSMQQIMQGESEIVISQNWKMDEQGTEDAEDAREFIPKCRLGEQGSEDAEDVWELISNRETDEQGSEDAEDVQESVPKRKREKPEGIRNFILRRKREKQAKAVIQKPEEAEKSEEILQSNGQMSIEEILAGWDKIQENARNVIAEAEQRKLERDKEQERQEAEYIMNRLAGVIPTGGQIEDMVREELLPEKMPLQELETDGLEFVADMEEGTEDVALSEEIAITEEELSEIIASMEEISGEEELVLEEIPEDILEEEEPVLEEIPEDILEEEEPVLEEIPEDILEEEDPVLEEISEEEIIYKEFQEDDEIIHQQERIQQVLEQQIREEHILQREVTFFDAETEEQLVAELNREQKEIFTYFTLIDGMEQQICQALEGMKQRKKKNQTSSAGNLVISGRRGSGKTVLAANFAKAYQELEEKENGKVGKISGSNMNKKNISELFAAIQGGCLIIEKAGDLSRESVEKISSFMEKNTSGLLVILEDESSGIQKVLARNADFTKKFTERIQIPIFTSDELVAFAKAYAKEYNCEIEEVGVLALYKRISSIQRLDEATTLTEVKEIMDDAIHRANRGGLMKLFGGKRTTDKGYVLIREKDFNK